MEKDKVVTILDRAIDSAAAHLEGTTRDATLGEEFDGQIERFLVVLREMRSSLHHDDPNVPRIGMCHAIVDGWPLHSELGTSVCEAERAYWRYRFA